MCISDWRIGRLIRSETKIHTPGIGATGTTAANQNRIGILFASLTSVATTRQWPLLLLEGVQIDLLTQNERWRLYTIDKHGNLPMRAWGVTTPVAANSVAVTEFFLPESYLAAGIEEFMRQYTK